MNLTSERLHEVLDYNVETGVFRWKVPMGAGCSRKLPGEIAGGYGGGDGKHGLYSRIGIDGKARYSHRLAWFYVYGVWPSRLDHVDRNKQNNAIGNLRLATVVQNSGNTPARNKLQLKGVRRRTENSYEARIGIRHKCITIGFFLTAQEAHKAYLEAAKSHFGEFARG